jgi:sarcosine/dimethylglycine N-methyltransferase
MTSSPAVQTARDYYNSDDADHFYSTIWGGEDIHIGVYHDNVEPIAEASARTVSEMASRVPLDDGTHILDMGSGYCGAARHLAKQHGARVTAINLSEVENTRARELNKAAGLDGQIEVHDGSFEQLPYDTQAFDVVWSQDAILHSERRGEVVSEAFRVLKPGGHFVFTDPMQSDECPDGVLQPILDRIHLSSLGSPRFYRAAAEQAGFQVVSFDNLTDQLINHYRRVLEETTAHAVELERQVSADYIQRMKAGLQRWIDGGQAGYLAWGIFQLRKP